MKTILLLAAAMAATISAQPAFYGRELLGRITDRSVTVNIAPVNPLEVYFEYGTSPGAYTGKTETITTVAATPQHVLIDKLQANTRYYYRLRYREPGSGATFQQGEERRFQTQRPRGSTFTFALQFDPHMDENSDAEVYRLTLRNQLAANPDFLIDLGDTFMSDKLQPITENAIVDRVRLMRSFYDVSSHSIPLLLCLGNHEGEWGRNLNGTPNNVAVWDTIHRKRYFPNPAPNEFYTGDATNEPLVGVREAYYSFEWGDALFVILDPYWNRPVAPEASGDWSLTLGRKQYDWLKQTLEKSTAKFKFVFAHNLIGGRDMQGPMRGGIETAKYLEWGGYNMDDTWGFDRARPGWPMPIHQLLVANKVTAFFHGHDHLYAKQDLDGVVYQEGPQPSARNFNLGTRGLDYSYTNGTVLGGTGYLRVTVSPDQVKTEYVQTWLPTQETAARKNGMVADTWTVAATNTAAADRDAAVFNAASQIWNAPVANGSVANAYSSEQLFDDVKPAVTLTDRQGVARECVVRSAGKANIEFLVPVEAALGAATVRIRNLDGTFSAARVDVAEVAPGLFSADGTGRGLASGVAVTVQPDGTRVQQPIAVFDADSGRFVPQPVDVSKESYLRLTGTGIRNAPAAKITARVGSTEVPVKVEADATGIDVVEIGPLPATLGARDEVEITLNADGALSNSLTFAVLTAPAAGEWGVRANLLEANSEMSVAELNGKIYVLGGYPASRVSVRTVQVYDPLTERWSLTTPLPVALNHTMSAAVNGKLYVIGGQTSAGGDGPFVNTVYEFDPAASKWTEKRPMPTERGGGAAAVIEGKIYVAGGRPPHGSEFAVYDPAADSWKVLPDLPTQRNHIGAAAIGGQMYVVGGRFDAGFQSEKTDRIEVYDPVANRWTSRAAMPKPRGGVNAIAAYGCLHVFGGEGNDEAANGVFPDHDVYHPGTDRWTRMAAMPTPVHGVTGMVFANGLLHLPGGGTSEGGSSGSVIHQVYRPAMRCR